MIAFLTIFILFFTLPCEAASLGGVAKGLGQPAHYMGELVRAIFLVTGIGLVISAIIKYMEYRRDHHTRLSLIIFLFLTGLALIGMEYIPMPESYH